MGAAPSHPTPGWRWRGALASPGPETICGHEQDGQSLDSGPSKTTAMRTKTPGGLFGTALLPSRTWCRVQDQGGTAAPAHPRSHISPGKVMGLPRATHCCRTSPLMPN